MPWFKKMKTKDGFPTRRGYVGCSPNHLISPRGHCQKRRAAQRRRATMALDAMRNCKRCIAIASPNKTTPPIIAWCNMANTCRGHPHVHGMCVHACALERARECNRVRACATLWRGAAQRGAVRRGAVRSMPRLAVHGGGRPPHISALGSYTYMLRMQLEKRCWTILRLADHGGGWPPPVMKTKSKTANAESFTSVCGQTCA